MKGPGFQLLPDFESRNLFESLDPDPCKGFCVMMADAEYQPKGRVSGHKDGSGAM